MPAPVGQAPLLAAVEPSDPARRYASVIYLCDATQSLGEEKFALLKAEMKKAIADLRPDQSFNVVFFRNDLPVSFGAKPQTLTDASENAKRSAAEFVDSVQLGDRRWDLQRAIEPALVRHPDAIYLVTSARANGRAVLTHAKSHKRIKKSIAPVHAVMLMESSLPAKTRESAERAMDELATLTGGTFRILPAGL